MTGWINWLRGRGAVHDKTTLEMLVADIHAQKPDHIVCSGDLCNLGLPAEWPLARRFLDSLGSPQAVSFVPGNHDAYLAVSLPGLLDAVRPYYTGDDGMAGFPYVRRRGPVAIVGLSSAVATPPFFATGTLGSVQLRAVESILSALKGESLCRIVVIHHPPHAAGTKKRRALTDAADLEAVLERAGAELVLFGHNHRRILDWLPGRDHASPPVPLLGVSSASAIDGRPGRGAAYHLLSIWKEDGFFRIESETRNPAGEGVTDRLDWKS